MAMSSPPWKPGWVDYLLIAVVTLLLLFAARGCKAPDPSPAATPTPFPTMAPLKPTPSASTVAVPVAIAHQTATVTIHRSTPREGMTASAEPPEDEDITITLDQAATATVEVPTPMPDGPRPVPAPSNAPVEDEHALLGLFVGTLPGNFAVDVETLHAKLPGNIEVSLDLLANQQAVAGMGAVGGHLFVGAGGYQAYDGSSGVFMGGGWRF